MPGQPASREKIYGITCYLFEIREQVSSFFHASLTAPSPDSSLGFDRIEAEVMESISFDRFEFAMFSVIKLPLGFVNAHSVPSEYSRKKVEPYFEPKYE